MSWHSTSAQDNTATSNLIRECQRIPNVNNIIIGGDFNTSPDAIQTMLGQYARARRGGNDWLFTLVNSGSYTHGNLELDFFVVLHKQALNANPIVCRCVRAAPSDHNPVFMALPLP